MYDVKRCLLEDEKKDLLLQHFTLYVALHCSVFHVINICVGGANSMV